MRDLWPRTILVELVGVFGVVFFSAGVVCVNQMTAQDRKVQEARPEEETAKRVPPLSLHQPGLFGVALAQGVILAVLLAVTVPVSGGYLNPAATIALWAFGRMDSRRTADLLAAQSAVSVLAATGLRAICDIKIMSGFPPDGAHFGAPHLNS